MLHRKLGSSHVRVPALGFGAMRLPMLEVRKDTKRRTGVDVPAAIRMLHRAFDLGIDYLDTAYGYHMGWSEVILGKALEPLPRDRLMVTTKMPVWLAEKPSDFDRLLRTQLRRLRTDYLDFYLLHALNAKSFDKVRGLGVLDFLEREKRRGRVRHVGFSYHDRAAGFRPIIDAFDWELCQIQYNIVDTNYQAGRSGLRYAARKGIGVVIMEPLRGGDLVGPHPAVIGRAWNGLRPKRPPVEWLLRWLWDQPGVSMVLSGMSSMEQLEQNVAATRGARVDNLNAEQRRGIVRISGLYRKLRTIPCTGCAYCMPCPSGVDIPRCFALYNDSSMFPEAETAWTVYNSWMPAKARAASCTECGQCLPRCPQQISIPEKLKEVDRALARG